MDLAGADGDGLDVGERRRAVRHLLRVGRVLDAREHRVELGLGQRQLGTVLDAVVVAREAVEPDAEGLLVEVGALARRPPAELLDEVLHLAQPGRRQLRLALPHLLADRAAGAAGLFGRVRVRRRGRGGDEDDGHAGAGRDEAAAGGLHLEGLAGARELLECERGCERGRKALRGRGCVAALRLEERLVVEDHGRRRRARPLVRLRWRRRRRRLRLAHNFRVLIRGGRRGRRGYDRRAGRGLGTSSCIGAGDGHEPVRRGLHLHLRRH